MAQLPPDQARDAGVISRIVPGIARKTWAQIGHEPGTRGFLTFAAGRRWDDPHSKLCRSVGHKKPRGGGGVLIVTC